jgi:peptide deformylase
VRELVHEGCLSVDTIAVAVERARAVRVEGLLTAQAA